jgi:hypothetical protein
VWKKIRKTWGDIDPQTKIEKSKDVYDRNEEKQKFKKSFKDYVGDQEDAD